jgi:adenine-specific DNA-methyltransferase
MPIRRRSTPPNPAHKPIEQYEHKDKQRVNNPPIGLVDAHTDNGGLKKKTYHYDPHLDPQLQWAGKAEHTSFEVPTVSLHVHERIDPRRIIETVKKEEQEQIQASLFEEKKPLREAIEFYKHKENWANRLIAGDSLLVMNSLLEKEGMGGKVQMVFFDPPYGIKYGSNFQPFVNKRDVKDGNDGDLTAEPEMIKAFRDTWELGIHSYLTYLRDRLLLAKDLLHESGSVFVQISDENVHKVRCLLDEVFGEENFVSEIIFRKKGMTLGSKTLETMNDFILWYAKDKSVIKYRQLYEDYSVEGASRWTMVELKNGTRRKLTSEEYQNHKLLPEGSKVFRLVSQRAPSYSPNNVFDFEFDGVTYQAPGCWVTNFEGMTKLASERRFYPEGGNLSYIQYHDDFKFKKLTNLWWDTSGANDKIYVVQTANKPIERCLLSSTDPGDLVLDITCGSGTTARVAEQYGRRWITCDTSRVAITLAKQRLMTANFDYFQLAHPKEGVGSGFVYKTVPHITLKSIANNEPAPIETLYDQPLTDNKKSRVTGPFTVEAVPAPVAKGVDSAEWEADASMEADTSVARSGETLRQDEWRAELLRAGVRAKGGNVMKFTRLEPMSGTRFLQAEGELVDSAKLVADSNQPSTTNHSSQTTKRVVVCFGPEHAPLEQRMVELALEEARTLRPKPEIILFCAFHFDAEARKDIEETNWPGITLLEAQMNADLLTDDLKKKRSSNESFWLIGQPDVQLVNSGEWLVDSKKQQIMLYGDCKKLSGADSMAEINQLSKEDLCLYAAISQGRNVWVGFTNAKGEHIHSLQYSRGSGEEHDRGVQTVFGNFQRIIGRIGDHADTIQRNEFPNGGKLTDFVKRLRGDQQIAQWLTQITIHSPLSTTHLTQVEVNGFDYYNPKTGTVESGGKNDIAMWMLDHDYDGRSLFPSQVFFPMAGAKEGWATLAKNLRAEIDEEKIEVFGGTVSLPFKAGKNVAVKIIDARGIESLKKIRL